MKFPKDSAWIKSMLYYFRDTGGGRIYTTHNLVFYGEKLKTVFRMDKEFRIFMTQEALK